MGDDDSSGGKSLSRLEKFNISVAIFVSLATALIGWKTFQLNEKASDNNAHLMAIERRLEEQRFGFERIRDIYDRTEKYLASEQDERRGRALVVLISSLPKSDIRSALLAIVTVESTRETVSVAAAESYVGSSLPKIKEKLSFSGEPILEFQQDGRSVLTKSEFGFTDSKGEVWTVPAGTTLGGASIPRIAWSAVGSPFSGKYRTAALLHEFYVTERSRPWKDVNRMFYEAMIASGVDEQTAKVLYAAVYSAGPRWDQPSKVD